ncbi:adenylyltransferase/cytidyltransferase family protein [bacterium]|nr:adenylyltransferase/cytidyltransferase family protein [bacterium]
MNSKNKIISIEEMLKIRSSISMDGKKLVFANGCFDILHVGHIRYMQDAASYGEFMVVAINSDVSVKALKGDARPYYPENERAEIISSIECVDYVIIFDDLNVSNLLTRIKPDFHAKGTDYTVDTVPEKEIMEKINGKVIICGDEKNHDSSKIIKRIEK